MAKDFLAACPAVWDETRLLEGDPGRFVTIARRSGRDWYVGAIAADAPRTAKIPLDFLGSGTHSATIYRDGNSDVEQVVEKQDVTASTVLEIPLRKNGGCAVRIVAP